MLRVVIQSRIDQPVHQGIRVLEELRAAGIPMVGVLWPMHAVHGQLAVQIKDGATVYEWAPDPDYVEEDLCA
jgi:hypothetical protein